MIRTSLLSLSIAGILLASVPRTPVAPPIDPRLLAGLAWRNVGPFRGGRVAAVSGAIGQPGVFYMGLPGGGVWKTTSAGETWVPVFDSVAAVSSIGAVEVAPSDPNIVYAGAGDLITGLGINEGNGVYKSTDAGATWQHVGLDESKQIPSMLVDPHDPNVVLVAAQGDVHKKSESRGVFRTTDGGRTWTRTLFADDSTGIQKLARAFDVPNVIFATTVSHYVPPAPRPRPPGGVPDTGRTGTALYKSTDAGVTWREITGGGLPRIVGRTSIAVAMHTDAQRVFIITNAGLWRSDDGGTTWRQMAADDDRIRNGQGGYNCGVYVDTRNPDIVYTISTTSYRSTDGGKTFTGFVGYGGDDPQQMWIDPTDSKRMLVGFDQGSLVTFDAGATWSSWYNQSTEQIYHLSTDNSYPYWIYATQQDAGAIRTRVRGTLGAITPMDWSPVPGWEWGTIVPDPLDPNVLYASGNGIVKIRYPTEQWIDVSPGSDPSLGLRAGISQPLVWAPWNQRLLLTGFQKVMATTDGGVHWRALSPDLGVPPNAPSSTTPGAPRPSGGAIESMSASTVAAGTIWVGTTNGLIKLTRDEGRTWTDVSIPDIPTPRRATIEMVDASHHAAGTAYAAVDLRNTGDYAPYLYRTRDYGKTWTKIVADLPTGQPSGSFARAIRADTRKAGLLFTGTESGMYVSFDDGDHWQPLMQGLPNTSYRDIAIKDNDLIVATYGRGLYALDDISRLRQLTPAIASELAHLFKPGDAVRVRRNLNANTPFPREVPHAVNPPSGAIIDYSLASAPQGEITLDVLDQSAKVVRHLSSAGPAPVAEAARPPLPNFWEAAPAVLTTNVGANRVIWDLRYDPPPVFAHTFELNANPGLTPPSPEGALVLPGTYTLRLTVNGRAYSQPVIVRADPRSPATSAALVAQHALQMKLTNGLRAAWGGYHEASELRRTVRAMVSPNVSAEVKAALATLEAAIDSVAGDTLAARNFSLAGGPAPDPRFVDVSVALVSQLKAQDFGDQAPTPAMLAGWAKACEALGTAMRTWQRVTTRDVPAFSAALQRNQISNVLAAPTPSRAVPCGT
ncbi:MAG TPA: hypothetical protein VM076_15585 [Gemmatimonadaceae bacterium]|nr:hypothetical protein [Gemmatimonadaceae bacterium]